MKRPLNLQLDFEQIGTIEKLTSIFQAIASIHIAQIKDKVVASTSFFNELWGVYSQLRSSKEESARLSIQHNGRTALIAITSEGGLIGDIDERIVEAMLKVYPGGPLDVFVIGAHGASLLAHRGLFAKQVVATPDLEKGESVRPLAQMFGSYEHAIVYYQTYVSLMRQDIARIDLFAAVRTLAEESTVSDEVISSRSYILEPSAEAIIGYMESVMVEIALGQVLLESKLAQYASRFNAMYSAKSKAQDLKHDLGLELHRAKRAAVDERIKETLSSRKAMHRH
jgi:F-type H+-transporting ATPase subunit gamma